MRRGQGPAVAVIDVRRPFAAREAAAAMARDGIVRVHGVFPRPLLERIRRLVERGHASGRLRREGLVRDIGGRYAAVLPFKGPFLDPKFYANPALLSIMRALLGSDFCIGSLETVISLPGSSPQHQHIDGPLRFDQVLGRRKVAYRGDLSALPSYAVALAVPLRDIDAANGPTAAWPGSHREALRPRLPGERSIAGRFREEPMAARFGEAYLFDYRIFHRGLPNYSRRARPLLMFVFTRSWFRDPNLNEVFPSVVISKRALARIPPRRRNLFMLSPNARRALWAR